MGRRTVHMAATIAAFLSIASFACARQGPPAPSTAAPLTTVFIVRHAEKATDPPDNPPLTPAGEVRAATLAKMLANANVTAVYASQFVRAQKTVEPFAAQHGLSVTVVNADDLDGLVHRILSENAGQTVLVAGHTNTIPQIIQARGGDPIAPIQDGDYNNMYVVTIPASGKPKVVQLEFGIS